MHKRPQISADTPGGENLSAVPHANRRSQRPRLSKLAAPVSSQSELPVLGVHLTDLTIEEALELIGGLLAGPRTCRTIYFANAHTLNLAAKWSDYRRTLQRADVVFGDGTGVRWATRYLHGAPLKDNVNGTDLTPLVLERFADRRLRYFLLGSTPDALSRASDYAAGKFSGWSLAGAHHGYLDDELSARVVERINRAQPHLLLVGMGNPVQEQWIDRHRDELEVPLCMAVGGLFTYWSGDLVRAPLWMRRSGCEWLHILVRQPRKFGRYVVGNPAFLWRLTREKRRAPELVRA